MTKMFIVGRYTPSNIAEPEDCIICQKAEWGDVIINGVCGTCAQSLLKQVLDAHQHYAGQTASGYWARLKNLEFDRTMDNINKIFTKVKSRLLIQYQCCEKAVQLSCVCNVAMKCPEHGEKHIGTHE